MISDPPQRKLIDIILRPTPAWRAILSLIVLFSLCLLLGLGKILIPLYPAISVAVAIYLYFKSPSLYVGYSFWFLFLGVVVRRVIDYQSGYLTPGPWTLTPTLVSLVSIITFFKEIPRIIRFSSYRKVYFPFLFCFIWIFYGLSLGLVQNSLVRSLVDCSNYICPLSFGFHIFFNWQRYPEYKRVIKQCFFWGVLCLGGYGIWQFFAPPAWDIFWLTTAETSSFGTPEPFGIRIMSTMSSPQAFSTVMLTGLILLFSESKDKIKNSKANIFYYPTVFAGYLTFLLSRARAGWIGFVFSLFLFAYTLDFKKQVRLVLVALFIVTVMSQIIYIEPFSSILLDRFSTLTDANSDDSLNTRKQTFQNAIQIGLLQIVGKGMGTDYSLFGGRDGSILPMLFVFGWIGIILLGSGLLLLLFRVFYRSHTIRHDSFANASFAITMGVLIQFPFNFVFMSSIGMIFWSFLSITLASQKYYDDKISDRKLNSRLSSL